MSAWMLCGHHSRLGGRESGGIEIRGIHPHWSHWCRSGRSGPVGGCLCGGQVRYRGDGLSNGSGGPVGGGSVGLYRDMGPGGRMGGISERWKVWGRLRGGTG